MFFNEVVGKKNKHKNRKAIWFEYLNNFGCSSNLSPSGIISKPFSGCGYLLNISNAVCPASDKFIVRQTAV
jgi:hypothetical protein